MPPAVAPAAQVRRTAAAVLGERGGDLGDLLVREGGLHHHLAGELHAGRLEVERDGAVPPEAPQAAVEVAGLAVEEQAADEGEHRVAEVAVQGGHRARGDAALEAVAHHQVRAIAQFGDERHQVAEVVAVVGVAHDHVLTAGREDAAHQGVAVTLVADGDDAGAGVLGEFLAAVGAAVVGDHDLAADPVVSDELDGLAHAGGHGLRLIETGHHDGQLHVDSIHRLPLHEALRTSFALCAARAGEITPEVGGYGLRVMPAASWRAAASLFGRNRLFAVALVPAVLLRIDAELGYRWQSWFNDSFNYVTSAVTLTLDPTRPSGYAVYLRVLEPFHSFALVTMSQHLMGLLVAVMIYALARHRFGVPAWVAVLFSLPVLYDGFEIQLEHLIMADTLFLFLAMAAVTLVLWSPRPSWRACLLAGFLLGLSAVVRSTGLPLLAVFAVYLFIRFLPGVFGTARRRWRGLVAALAACGVAFAVPVVAYEGWYDLQHGEFTMTDSTGVFLYSRVMTFADCSRMQLPTELLSLCTTVPPARRPISQAYIWTPASPLDRFPAPKFSPLPNKLAEQFAIT